MTTATRSELLLAGAAVDVTAADDGGKPAAFKIIAYVGKEPMRVPNLPPVVVVHDGIELPATGPVLADHENRLTAVVGSGTPSIEGGARVVRGTLARSTEAAARVIALWRAGVRLAASVGLEILRACEVAPGDTAVVNGRKIVAPPGGLVIVLESRYREVSIVPIGADKDAHVASLAASASHNKGAGRIMADEIILATDADVEDRELERVEAIRAISAEYAEVKVVEVGGKRMSAGTFVKRSIADGSDPRKLRTAFLRASLSNGANMDATPAIHVAPQLDSLPDLHASALACAVGRSLGMAPSAPLMGKDYGSEQAWSERVLELANTPAIRGLTSLHALMDTTIRCATGSGFAGSRRSPEFVNEYVRAAKTLEASGSGFSTLTVAHILEDAGNKALLNRFALTEPVWPLLCEKKDLADFKPAKLYRMDADLGLLPINPQGQFTHGTLVDTKRTVQAETFGRMIALDRRHTVNDDLGAFQQIINGLADGSAWSIESAVFTVLLGNADNFFHGNNNNLIDAPLGLAGLEEAETAFGSHVGAGGKPIAGSASILVVGNALATTGRQLLAPLLLNVDSNAASLTQQNPFASKYTLAKTPYLDVTSIRTPAGAAISGQSATLWFLMSNPEIGAAITVGLLNGNMAPTIQSSETDFNTLGMQWRAYWDYGVAQGDPQYAVMSSGDASG